MIIHSAFQSYYLWLPLVGVIVGLIGTLIGGGGGGFFFIPILILLFGVPAHIAVTTSLAATIPICAIGSIGFYRNGYINARVGLLMSAAGIIGAMGGAEFVSLITHKQLIILYGVFTILMALYLLAGIWRSNRDKANGIEPLEDTRSKKLAKGSFFGFLAGVVTAVSGATGATQVQAGLFAMRLPLKTVIGTSLMVVMANSVSALGAHFLVGKIDLTLIYFLTAGTVVGSLIGPKLLRDVKLERFDGPVRTWFAVGMILLGVLMLLNAFGILTSSRPI